jgi:hypothetical protein
MALFPDAWASTSLLQLIWITKQHQNLIHPDWNELSTIEELGFCSDEAPQLCDEHIINRATVASDTRFATPSHSKKSHNEVGLRLRGPSAQP